MLKLYGPLGKTKGSNIRCLTVGLNLLPCADPEGGGGGPDPPENHKNIGFISNTIIYLDPLKNSTVGSNIITRTQIHVIMNMSPCITLLFFLFLICYLRVACECFLDKVLYLYLYMYNGMHKQWYAYKTNKYWAIIGPPAKRH